MACYSPVLNGVSLVQDPNERWDLSIAQRTLGERMAEQPTTDAAPESPAKPTSVKAQPKFAGSGEQYIGLFSSGIPAHVSYGNRLYLQLPEVTALAINEVLDRHVTQVRKTLSKDENYAELAPYYDVVQDDVGGDMLSFGFHGLPAHLSERATALEYGDAEGTPMQGFVRRTLHREATPITNQVSAESDRLMGEMVVSHG